MSDLLITDEALWRELVTSEMRLRGYTDEEIEAADKHRCDLDECEWDANHMAWNCDDENGKSHHPIANEYADIVGIIGRALEALTPPQRDLAETATRVGYGLGRRDAAEEIAQAIEARSLPGPERDADVAIARGFATRPPELSGDLTHPTGPTTPENAQEPQAAASEEPK